MSEEVVAKKKDIPSPDHEATAPGLRAVQTCYGPATRKLECAEPTAHCSFREA